MGRDMGHTRNYSEDVAAIIDEETKLLLATAHQEAFDILEENRDVLDSLVLALMEKETLDKEQIARDLRAAAPPFAPTGVDRVAGPEPLQHPAGGDPREGPRRRSRRSDPRRPRGRGHPHAPRLGW